MAPQNSEEITTVKLKRLTKDRLDRLRTHRRDTYDEILQRILNVLNVCRLNPELAQKRLRKMESSLKRSRKL